MSLFSFEEGRALVRQLRRDLVPGTLRDSDQAEAVTGRWTECGGRQRTKMMARAFAGPALGGNSVCGVVPPVLGTR